MKIRGHPITALLVPITLAAVALPGMGAGTLYAAEKGMGAPPVKVEVIIKDREKGYETTGFALMESPTVMVVRNQDTVTHGFTSRLFKEVPVRMEGDGLEVTGKRLKSFHVDPGKTMTLHFTKGSEFDPATGIAETQHYVFWCDIHPEVKGEVLVVETRGEIGGG